MPLTPEQQAEIDEARARHPQIEFVTGTEMDYLGALEDRQLTEDALAPFRFRLLSVHFIDGWAFDDPDQKARWTEPGAPDAIWRRYGELWCEAASNASLPYDAMSHPDLAKKFGYYPSFSLESLYDEMAEAARAGGRMVEVNTSGSYYACKEMFPAPALLAGHSPFERREKGQNTRELMRRRIARATFVRIARDDVPDALQQVLATAMARDPERRYRTAAEFGEAVREVQRRRLEWMAGIGCDGVDPGERQKWPFWGGPQGCVEAWHCGRHPNEPQRVPQAGIPGAAPAAAGPNRNPPPLPACPLSRQH